MPNSYKEMVIEHKYKELPEEPKYKKKKKKIHIRSDHKHRYASAIFDCGLYKTIKGKKEPYYYVGTYCVLCGRIESINIGGNITNPNLPVFKADWTAKRINLEDIGLG